MSSADSFDINVKDVYDFAYDIAQEFDKIVGIEGMEIINPVVNKVIRVLELLEVSINRIERLERESSELKSKYNQLASERSLSDHEKSKLRQAFEDTEESWIQEFVNLKAVILKLKTENKLLKGHLAEKEQLSDTDDSFKDVIQDKENFISKLKSSLQEKDKQLQKGVSDIDALNCKIEDLIQENKSLHLHNLKYRNQIDSLKLEGYEYEHKVDLQDQKITVLEESLAECTQFSLDEKKYQGDFTEDFPYSMPVDQESAKSAQETVLNKEMFILIQEQKVLQEKVKLLQLELNFARNQAKEYKEKLSTLTIQESSRSIQKSGIRQLFQLFLGVVAITPNSCWL